jgi:hypothetical protein
LGALVDMPLHIPIVSHKSAMDAYRDTLLLKKGLALDLPIMLKLRKICDDAQKAQIYKMVNGFVLLCVFGLCSDVM